MVNTFSKQALHACNDLGILARSKSRQSKTCWGLDAIFSSQENTLGTNQAFAEVWSEGHIQKQSRENLGFPSKDMKNKGIKNIKNMHDKNMTHLFQKLRFRAMSSKTWTWVPIQEDHARINTKTWFLFQTFGLKRDFSSKTQEHHFHFKNQLLNQCMACKTKSIMQCSLTANKIN